MAKVYHKFGLTDNTCMTCGVQRRNPGKVATVFEYSNDDGETYVREYINCTKRVKYVEKPLIGNRHSWEKLNGTQWRCSHCGILRTYDSMHNYVYTVASGRKTVTISKYVGCIERKDDSEFYK